MARHSERCLHGEWSNELQPVRDMNCRESLFFPLLTENPAMEHYRATLYGPDDKGAMDT